MSKNIKQEDFSLNKNLNCLDEHILVNCCFKHTMICQQFFLYEAVPTFRTIVMRCEQLSEV